MNRQKTAFALLSVGILSLWGCSNQPTATEQDFGNSVRQMVSAQTLNPDAGDTEPVESSDPKRLEKALDTYRNDVSKPETVRRDPTVDIFSQQSQ